LVKSKADTKLHLHRVVDLIGHKIGLLQELEICSLFWKS